jgi:CRISPR system Cascade subunit CasB
LKLSEEKSKGELIRAHTATKIGELQDGKDDSEVRATLAKLRRGIGKPPGSDPELWKITLEGLPPKLAGKDGIPSHGELAVHTALTLYAMHQQSKQSKHMSVPGRTLGRAVRSLAMKRNGDNFENDPVKRRFVAAATSNTIQEFSHHLRGLIQLMRAEDVTLDYPELAKDLFGFQFTDGPDRMRLKWGRDFYYNSDSENDDEIEEEKSNEEK